MRKIGRFLGGFIMVAMYLIQIYGYFILYGPGAALIAFLFPPAILGYPFFFQAANGFWPTGWIIWFVVGIILYAASNEKDESEKLEPKDVEFSGRNLNQADVSGYCSKCGSPRKQEENFCSKCGQRLE